MYIFILASLITVILSCGNTAEKPVQEPKGANADQIELVLIKGGTFKMGIKGGEFDEGPVHEVTLSDFYVGKYEITVAQYRKCIEETERKMPIAPNWGWKDDDPIVNVSWTDAESYATWLSKKTGETYRLPTEAEWYYVASDGGKSIKYGWGDGEPRANVADESAAEKGSDRYWKGYDDGFPYTSPVGSFAANLLGVHDMGGNAAEWVSNFHYTFPVAPQTDPKGPSKGKNKVFKGASFKTNAWYSRIAQRNFMPVTFKNDYLGFRVVKELKTGKIEKR